MSKCQWPGDSQIMQAYHDTEWCVPNYNDTYIFEMLILEGAQAGLSWNIVMNKREEYKRAFNNFDISFCANLTDEQISNIKENYNVIKSQVKLNSVRSNAQAFIKVQDEFGSFSNYLWGYVDNKPIVNKWTSESQMPAQTKLSEKLSKDLKKRGFKFIGDVIMYSFMQAVGMVDDHIVTCTCHTSNRIS